MNQILRLLLQKGKSVFLTLFFLTAFVVHSFATWSIIIIDPATKEIGIAGASCTYSVYGIGAIAAGKGAIIVQAMSNNDARARGLEMILADKSPENIMQAIKNPMFDPEEQQYAIICVDYLETPLTYTGTLTTENKGALTAKGISVQGNTLANATELQAVMDAAIQGQKDSLPIQEILMLALEAGAKQGGDKRCGERKASSAFLTVAKPGDTQESPFLNLIVNATDETSHAVEILGKKLAEWKEKSNGN